MHEINKGWYVYMVRCNDDTIYTGISNNVAKRIQEHNNTTSGAKYLRGKTPVTLVYLECAIDRSTASKREYVIKKLSRNEKELLISAASNLTN